MLGKNENLKVLDFNGTSIGREALIILVNWAFNFNSNIHLLDVGNTIKKNERRIECADVKLEELDGITTFEFKRNSCRIVMNLDCFE